MEKEDFILALLFFGENQLFHIKKFAKDFTFVVEAMRYFMSDNYTNS